MIKPQLDANNVGLVAVGLERLGVDEFLEKKFFAGSEYQLGIKMCLLSHCYVSAVYIDEMKQNYKDLGFKRYFIESSSARSSYICLLGMEFSQLWQPCLAGSQELQFLR